MTSINSVRAEFILSPCVYLAILRGAFPSSTVTCNRRIVRKGSDSIGRPAYTLAEGKLASTIVRPLTFATMKNSVPVTLAELLPITHIQDQMIIHCKALGYPILKVNDTHLIQKWIAYNVVVEEDRLTAMLEGELRALSYGDSGLKDFYLAAVTEEIFPNDLPLSDIRTIR